MEQQFLKSFFQVFNATLVDLRISGNEFTGIIRWVDEEDEEFATQHIRGILPDDYDLLHQANELCNILGNKGWLHGDKVTIHPGTLKAYLLEKGWDNTSIDKVLRFLTGWEVEMVDNGIATDSFFLHF